MRACAWTNWSVRLVKTTDLGDAGGLQHLSLWPVGRFIPRPETLPSLLSAAAAATSPSRGTNIVPRVIGSRPQHQRRYWDSNPCLLIQITALDTMAGLVYSAYQGCQQERYHISHSSCFDVWDRSFPVPPPHTHTHRPGMCSLWVHRLGTTSTSPLLRSSQSPNEYWRLWSLCCSANTFQSRTDSLRTQEPGTAMWVSLSGNEGAVKTQITGLFHWTPRSH